MYMLNEKLNAGLEDNLKKINEESNQIEESAQLRDVL